MTWHVLDVGSVWLKEFASVLSARVPAICWDPAMQWLPGSAGPLQEISHRNPDLTIRRFPLQRGYARFPLSALLPFAPVLTARLTAASSAGSAESAVLGAANAALGDARASVLVCTTPYYAPVAERWPGPVIYYQTDLTVAYAGVNPRLIRKLDQRLCRVARLVCPNSDRIARYFQDEAFCPERKMVVIPNATRAVNIAAQPLEQPGPRPADAADLPGPVIGVIGNLAANMDWVYLEDTIRRTPGFSWLFVGPSSMPAAGPAQTAARNALLAAGGRVRFIGPRPYGELQTYARCFDAALLPYRLSEPTYSGSSTRFYEHLAACRPILATRGFAELLHKEPLLTLVDRPADAAAALKQLRTAGFRDGREELRWRASFDGTWERRVETMIGALGRMEETGTARGRRGEAPQTSALTSAGEARA